MLFLRLKSWPRAEEIWLNIHAPWLYRTFHTTIRNYPFRPYSPQVAYLQSGRARGPSCSLGIQGHDIISIACLQILEP